MRNLEYFISVILIAIAFTNGTHKSDVTVSERQINDFASNVTSYELDFSHQISYVNIFRSQNTTQRTNHAQHKHHFEFVKTGKISSTGISCSIQETTSNIPSSSTRTAHRLIRLGKLII